MHIMHGLEDAGRCSIRDACAHLQRWGAGASILYVCSRKSSRWRRMSDAMVEG